MSSDGASPAEQLLDCARRNNTDILETALAGNGAETVNNARDPMGNTALHLCSQYGSYDVLDVLLDLDGVEIDPVNNAGDTPLHVCVRYAETEPEHGQFIASNLIECGADPRIKNKQNRKPIDLIHSAELEPLVDLLQSAELAADAGFQEGEEVEDEE